MADASATQAKAHKLDDVMIAMDVVDTIRHREDLVRRELNDAAREAELIERLREIYRQQGIEVTDKVLAEGVKALKESRFTYTPKPPSWRRTLLEIWVKRTRYASWAAVAAVLLLSTCSYQYLTVSRPAQLAEEQARVEMTETLPRTIRQIHADVLRVATAPAVKPKANKLLLDGERAIRDQDRAGMRKIETELKRLLDDVTAEYTFRIVSRAGETTGVWRRPPKGATLRNHYVIVEPISPDGRKISLPIVNEETGQTEVVDKLGVRVPQATWEAVASDKRDDGIVQNSRFAVKRRGTLDIEYLMPFDGGMITKW